MNRLNYQHLFYFWHVVKEGSISRACERLHVAQPTISGQLSVFEQTVGERLYIKDGRKLVLSDTGRTIFHYADEIFSLGQELTQTLQGLRSGHGLRLNVGVSDALPKLIAYRLLAPALTIPKGVQMICHEDKVERLIAEIPHQRIDLVLSDIPATPSIGARVFNHFLGECELAFFGTPDLLERYSNKFPASLNGAPLLMPTQNKALRRSLDQWLYKEGLCPEVKAEIEDSALLKTFASAGVGMFVAPIAVQTEILKQYGCHSVGLIPSVFESFYAITSQRKLKHPAVMAILENTASGLFI